jgi:DNA-binding MarR family transcriptional regulator
MTTGYVGIVALAERLHRRSLDLLEAELSRRGIVDLNATQAMILLQMKQDQMTVSELTLRGCYQGTNVSYNLKKLIESGYVIQARSSWDRRVVHVSASEKGRALLAQLQHFYAALEVELAECGMDDLIARCEAGLARLERLSASRLSQVKRTRSAPPDTLLHAA